MKNSNKIYNRVYDFTNENVSCLKDLYHFENSKVLTVVGSGDQFFSSVLNGAKKVDLFDINSTSYLYFLLKFYSIRELTYEEFYEFLVLKKFTDLKLYRKLESVLPNDVLKYYKYLIENNKKRRNNFSCFRLDGIDLLLKSNQKYYFNNDKTVIPYFIKENYYKLQEIIKKITLTNFFETNILNLNDIINQKYDIILISNIYNSLSMNLEQYTELLKKFDSPEIQACYDWNGWFFNSFSNNGYLVDRVLPSSPDEYNKKNNYVYSLRR